MMHCPRFSRPRRDWFEFLANSSSSPQLTNTTTVGPSIGNGFDGDALTFLSSDDGSAGGNWTADQFHRSGHPGLPEITYYLVVPQATNRYNLTHSAGPADSSGYEQQFPLKWLVRRVDGVTPGPVLESRLDELADPADGDDQYSRPSRWWLTNYFNFASFKERRCGPCRSLPWLSTTPP